MSNGKLLLESQGLPLDSGDGYVIGIKLPVYKIKIK